MTAEHTIHIDTEGQTDAVTVVWHQTRFTFLPEGTISIWDCDGRSLWAGVMIDLWATLLKAQRKRKRP